MKKSLNILIACLALANVAVMLSRCEKHSEEQPSPSLTVSADPTAAVTDRDNVTSCTECNFEWRVFCVKQCGVSRQFDKIITNLSAKTWDENQNCCVNYQNPEEWLVGEQDWTDMNPGVLKSSVYPACGGGNAELRVSALMKDANNFFILRLPGTFRLQIRRKGDTFGTTLTQHFIQVNTDLSECTLTGGPFETVIPVTIENDCRITSSVMMTPDSPIYICPYDEGGTGTGGTGGTGGTNGGG